MPTIIGTEQNDTLNGGSANDSIEGLGGHDRLYGYEGNDTLKGGIGNDRLYGGTGNNQLSGNEGNDLLQVEGSGFNVLNGGEGNDTLKANSGSDTLSGGLGSDSLQGGNGHDLYFFNGGDGNDTIQDTGGIDTVRLNAYEANGDLLIDLTSTSGVTGSGPDHITWNANSIEHIYSDRGDDTIIGSAADNFIFAFYGDDSVRGGAGNDSIYGLYGNDTLRGDAGTDWLYGYHGDDVYVIDNNWGTDFVEDNVGHETLNASTVTTDLTVRLVSSGSAEVTDGVNSMDWEENCIEDILSGSGNDDLTGNSKGNYIAGNAGHDTLRGHTGNDTLLGGTGNDTYLFSKGDGQDIINDTGNTGDLDTIRFASTLPKASIAFWEHGDDLSIAYVANNTDKIEVLGQALAANKVERFEASNGFFLTDSEVAQVVQDMAAYASNHGFTINNVNDVKNNTDLMAIVNAAWHT